MQPLVRQGLDLRGQVGLGVLAQLDGHYGSSTRSTYGAGDLDLDSDVDLDDWAALPGAHGTMCEQRPTSHRPTAGEAHAAARVETLHPEVLLTGRI